MAEMSQTVTASPASSSLPARILGVLFSPRATYAGVAAQPRALGVLLVVALLSGAGLYTFLSTEVGKQASLEQQTRMLESFGVKITDAQYERMQQGIGRGAIFAAVGQLVTLPLFAAIIAGIALGIFNALLSGDGTFRQVYAIVCHSGVVILLSQAFGLPLAYARATLTSAANLAVFAPFLDETSFAARALGSIDLFILWWIVSLSIGLGVLYKKRTSPIAWSFTAVYVFIGLVIAGIRSAT
jgi:Yip1 domain